MKFNHGITIISGLGVREFNPESVKFLPFPENNQHPMEQIKSMERLVESYIDNQLPLNIKTNSPEIIQAINLYMLKAGISDQLHGGLVDQDGNLTECDDLDPIFEDLAKSFDFLMELRSDVENPNDEKDDQEKDEA